MRCRLVAVSGGCTAVAPCLHANSHPQMHCMQPRTISHPSSTHLPLEHNPAIGVHPLHLADQVHPPGCLRGVQPEALAPTQQHIAAPGAVEGPGTDEGSVWQRCWDAVAAGNSV